MEICFFASNVVGYWRLYGRKSAPAGNDALDDGDHQQDEASP
jgi:hypothetical protein